MTKFLQKHSHKIAIIGIAIGVLGFFVNYGYYIISDVLLAIAYIVSFKMKKKISKDYD